MGRDDIVVINVRKIMRQKGLKQNAVAERAGIPIPTFYALTTGRKQVTTQYILPISKALEVTPNELFAPIDHSA